MGNCLDLPSPPPKYKYKQRNVDYPALRRSGHELNQLAAMMALQQQNAFLLQNYALPPPMLTFDPLNGNVYPAPQFMPVSENYFPYQDNFILEAKSGNRLKAYKNKNVSTVISTFENPQDDVIFSGEGAKGVAPETKKIASRPSVSESSGHDKLSPRTSNAETTTSEPSYNMQQEDTMSEDGSQSVEGSQPPGVFVTYLEDAPVEEEPEKEEEEEQEDVPKIYIDNDMDLEYPPETNEVMTFTKEEGAPHLPKYDVFICCSKSEETLAEKIKDLMWSFGISTWMKTAEDDGKTDELQTGKVIIQAKICLVILSKESVKDKCLFEEVCLGNISSTVVLPINVDVSVEVLANMEKDMRLQVAHYKWREVTDESLDLQLDRLVVTVKDELESINSYNTIIGNFGEVSSSAINKGNKEENKRIMSQTLSLDAGTTASDLWETLFDTEMSVEWSRFQEDISENFKDKFSSSMSTSDQDIVMEGLRKEITIEPHSLVHKAQFVSLCSFERTDRDVWETLQEIARQCLAIRSVLHVHSSVRLAAVEHIATFKNHFIMKTMAELAEDNDANYRSVAVIALARCMTSENDALNLNILLNALLDSDRLVREAACVALGTIQAKKAYEQLFHLWRNDVIPQVRDAAETALHNIGGAEADEAMRMTSKLSNQIRLLSE